jgi:hypothetical protein
MRDRGVEEQRRRRGGPYQHKGGEQSRSVSVVGFANEERVHDTPARERVRGEGMGRTVSDRLTGPEQQTGRRISCGRRGMALDKTRQAREESSPRTDPTRRAVRFAIDWFSSPAGAAGVLKFFAGGFPPPAPPPVVMCGRFASLVARALSNPAVNSLASQSMVVLSPAQGTYLSSTPAHPMSRANASSSPRLVGELV